MKDNKLIAEFMGYHTSDTQFKDENGFWNDTNVFETSWDWLMPVVRKIEQLNELIGAHILSSDRDATYQAVVKFIKTKLT